MRVAFRVDAAAHIGGGHLARCLTLADALAQRGCECHFLSGPLSDSNVAQVTMRGHSLHYVDAQRGTRPPIAGFKHTNWLGCSQEVDALASREHLARLLPDWLVVDHYGIDWQWESLAGQQARRLMVIDDLADRAHHCDLLLDQNYYSGLQSRYRGLVPEQCQLLLGPRVALLRPEFTEARAACQLRNGTAMRVFVFISSFDPENYTGMVLDAIAQLGRSEIGFDIVAGADHPDRDRLAVQARELGNCTFHSPAPDIWRLMSRADLAIGAGGSTTLERCYLGLPTIAMHVAANQQAMLADIAAAGCLMYLGAASDTSAADLSRQLERTLLDSAGRATMSKRSWDLVADGKAAAVERMMALLDA